jgi:8-oxo-dGDP phosphatase
VTAEAPVEGATRVLSTATVYETPWLRVREDDVLWPGGTRGVYSVVERADYSVAMPRQDDGFWLVQQYRHTIGRRAWEFPQGGWPHGSAGGSFEELARAELREEAGLRAGRLTGLGVVNAAYGFVRQRAHVYLAEDLEQGEPAREETEQDMVHAWHSDREIAALVRSGGIVDATALAALTLYRLHTP